MLTKSDVKIIRNVFKSELTIELKPLKQDINLVKNGTITINKDILSMKEKLNEFASFVVQALGNVLDWSEDIHDSIVKEKLPERVKKLERFFKSS